jgi:AcrR family transcriptional regulator
MTGRKRWSTEEILDTATELLRVQGPDAFSVRKLAAALGTDSSSLYRHFRNKTELLRAVTDQVFTTALDGYRPEGDWKHRITTLTLRLRDTFAEHPQLAAVWGRYASSSAGSRQVMEVVLQALQTSGLPEAKIPAHYHRLAVLFAALISSEAVGATITPEEHTHGMDSFRLAVLGADPDHYPALAHFAREIRPLHDNRRTVFEELIAAQLAAIEAELPRQTPKPGRA